jgi:hypothetical protein
VTRIVPVVTPQVGCVRVAFGTAGAAGTALITIHAEDMQVGLILLRTFIVYVLQAVKPLNVGELCHVVQSMLYSKSAPLGDVTTIVPVVTAHVGCVMLTCGTAGASGTGLIIKLAEDMHVGSILLRTKIV